MLDKHGYVDRRVRRELGMGDPVAGGWRDDSRVLLLERFPRWRVWNRVFMEASDDASTLWGGLLIVVAFGFVGAFLLLPKDADWGARFFSAVGAGVLATAVAWGLFLAIRTLIYRARGYRGSAWEVRWALGTTRHKSGALATSSSVVLECKASPPANVSELGYVEAVVRQPSGAYRGMISPGFRESAHSLAFSATGGVAAPPPPGTYEVRWYGTTRRRRQYEIARSTFTVPDDAPAVTA